MENIEKHLAPREQAAVALLLPQREASAADNAFDRSAGFHAAGYEAVRSWRGRWERLSETSEESEPPPPPLRQASEGVNMRADATGASAGGRGKGAFPLPPTS